MVEKRARKFNNIVSQIPPPQVEGPQDAELTLVGWGSTYGVIREAAEQLRNARVAANHLHVKWIVPLHGEAVTQALSRSRRIIIVESNYSGQFARYLRSETGISAHGHIRKYDGEPFMPHHIVNGVLELLAGKTNRYVPFQEIMV
jgi:2-oxoglutarate ferredoxin oxidoreductase subunit alpha